MNKTKNTKGITLVALVVTIIVLLILAGVAINLMIGDNGLFKRAEIAGDTWKQAQQNEENELQSFANTYDEILKNLVSNSEGRNPLEEITGNETKNTDTTDKEGNRIVVPAGFKVINPESTVEEGIVIEDVSANNSDTVGNQFVWIPCEIETEENKNNGKLKYNRHAYTRDDWDFRQIKLDEKDEDGSYKIKRIDQPDHYYHEKMPEDERESIAENGGFYMGRYEIGCDMERTEDDKGDIEAVRKNKIRIKSIQLYNNE